jgi:hypothetical protein
MWKHYVACSFVYGTSRKILQTSNGRCIETPKYKRYNMVPLLFTQRLAIIIIGGTISAVCLPMYAIKDLGRLEVAIRNVDPSLYGYGNATTIFDIMTE